MWLLRLLIIGLVALLFLLRARLLSARPLATTRRRLFRGLGSSGSTAFLRRGGWRTYQGSIGGSVVAELEGLWQVWGKRAVKALFDGAWGRGEGEGEGMDQRLTFLAGVAMMEEVDEREEKVLLLVLVVLVDVPCALGGGQEGEA